MTILRARAGDSVGSRLAHGVASAQFLGQLLELLSQSGKIVLDGISNDLHIHLEIAVRHGVAHFIGLAEAHRTHHPRS